MAGSEYSSAIGGLNTPMFKLAEYLPPFPNVTRTLARQASVAHAVSQVPLDDLDGLGRDLEALSISHELPRGCGMIQLMPAAVIVCRRLMIPVCPTGNWFRKPIGSGSR